MTLIDTVSTPSIPSIDPAERVGRLAEAGGAWADRIAADASSAHLTYRVRGIGEGSVASRITTGSHEFLIDEPAALAGDDVALDLFANPTPVSVTVAKG